MNKKTFNLRLTVTQISIIVMFVLIGTPASIYAIEVTPDQLEFRRQAVRRMIFDRSQDIQLSGLWPAKVVGLDVMHPPVGQQENDPQLTIEDGRLRISAEKPATAITNSQPNERIRSFRYNCFWNQKTVITQMTTRKIIPRHPNNAWVKTIPKQGINANKVIMKLRLRVWPRYHRQTNSRPSSSA
jgi:hypothetical protein